MDNIRYLTAGESHGVGLSTIIEGIPSNLDISGDFIDRELARRQIGYGRGGRMNIEKDSVKIISGIRHGRTIGSPISFMILNKDWDNWKDVMAHEASYDTKDTSLNSNESSRRVTRPRPGHADLSGAIKYNQKDMRNILERSSARETAARVAVGAVAKRLLGFFGIGVYSWVTEIGPVNFSIEHSVNSFSDKKLKGKGPNHLSSVYYSEMNNQRKSIQDIFPLAENSDVRCPCPETSELMRKCIDTAKAEGNSLGGVFEIIVTGVPVGLGSHVHWDRKLDARLAMAVMSIQAIKGVEIGIGFDAARTFGADVHDEIFYNKTELESSNGCVSAYYRGTNNAGGIEGGMSNGEDIVIRAAMKPIPTLYKPLKSVDIESKKAFSASVERSDICAVPAAAVIGEAVVAIEMADTFLHKFGGDSIEETDANYRNYCKYVNEF